MIALSTHTGESCSTGGVWDRYGVSAMAADLPAGQGGVQSNSLGL